VRNHRASLVVILVVVGVVVFLAIATATSSRPGAHDAPAALAREPYPHELVENALVLLSEIEACGDDMSCAAARYEPSTFPREPLLRPVADAQITVRADFGTVGVVRVTRDGTAQDVTLVYHANRWLVRAVDGVTDASS
jgi:hypothetical protein